MKVTTIQKTIQFALLSELANVQSDILWAGHSAVHNVGPDEVTHGLVIAGEPWGLGMDNILKKVVVFQPR